MNDIPDFSSSVDYIPTSSGDAIATQSIPDFSDSEDVKPVTEKSNKIAILSRISRFLTKGSPIDNLNTQLYLLKNNPPEKIDNESLDDYSNRVSSWESENINKREEEIQQDIATVLETPMMGAIGVGAITAPVPTAIGLAGFAALDQMFSLSRFQKKNFPDTNPDIAASIQLADWALKGGIIGAGFAGGKTIASKLGWNAGIGKNTNISSENISKIKNSVELLPEEKIDIQNELKITDTHVDSSINSGLPINVDTANIVGLANKPYWERLKNELGVEEIIKEEKPPENKQELISRIQSIKSEKELSNITVSRLKKFIGIENLKKSDIEQLSKLESFLGDLKKEDKFLSEKQITDLKDIIKELPSPEITPKRVIIEKFGEKEDVLTKGVMGKVINEIIPTVDIKQGHPLIEKIVNDARDKFTFAEKEINRRNKQLDEMLNKAEKSRYELLSPSEKLSRSITPQNKEIFEALGGSRVNLTKEEVAVVAYLKNFFKMVKDDLQLEKYRKNYVTHIEKDLTEKILNKGLINGVKEVLSGQKQGDIPVDIMLELENIIGSEKFFKYAMERKGGTDPTTNLRQIINTYSHMYESKKALDQILPEGQAITNNLLKGKSALWMKRFLQNLKGRGLDFEFRNGKSGWLSKVADGIVDIGYLKMLGFNWKSALKNVVAGETNSWIYQDFSSYLIGKQRFIENPKKAYEIAKEYGILEGTYSDFAQKGIGKLKKLQDLSMVGQKAGEVEVRSTILTSMLTESEWKTGELSKERVNEIKDTVAITQGIFSKTDTPLLLQTWYGRMFFQMNRWRITNAMLLRRITNNALKDVKEGKYNTQNTTRLGKTLVAYGVGMYLSYELSKAGYKTAGQVARNMAQNIDGIVSLFSEGQLVKMFTDNPTLSTLTEISNTIQNTAKYLHVPGAKKAREPGIEDTYVAPVETIKEITEGIE